jgi:hypothetical protein
MIRIRPKQALAAVACVLASVAAAGADETPETILIRRTLANELSGHRRGDADLVLSAYEEGFAGLQGHDNADPRVWTVQYEGLQEYAEALRQDVAQYRYETDRAIAFIHVRADQAMVTSQDSGQVVDRASGATRSVDVRRFWILRKTEEVWRVALLVDALGDTLVPSGNPAGPDPRLVELLGAEAAAWNAAKPGRVAGHYDERFIGCSGNDSFKPESWAIIFSGAVELEAFLKSRLKATTYQIDRQVVSTAVGDGGNEAIAVTHERVRTSHAAGDVVHSLERDVLWTVSRRSGTWKVTTVCYGIALAE